MLRSTEGDSVAIVVASKGRPEAVGEILRWLSSLGWSAKIIVSVAGLSDLPKEIPPGVVVLVGPAGLTKQRNTALKTLEASTEYVVFFDDDFLPSKAWLSSMLGVFQVTPSAGSVTGRVVYDGMVSGSIGFEKGFKLLERPISECDEVVEVQSPYGCNMMFRMEAIKGKAFDERLPLYAWLEDLDMGGQLRQAGWKNYQVMRSIGVHLGLAGGRVSGIRMGYSQIVNNVYLWKKGTAGLLRVVYLAARCVAGNVLYLVIGDQKIDRKGRIIGNAKAFIDVLLGRIEPEKIQRL